MITMKSRMLGRQGLPLLVAMWSVWAMAMASLGNAQTTTTNGTKAPAPATPPSPPVVAAPPAPPPLSPMEASAMDACTGVFLQYQFMGTPLKIYPFMDNTSTLLQPYRFESEVTLTNTGFSNVLGWEVFVGFQHGEIIADAPGVLFVDGESTPGVFAGNGTTVMGTDQPDLKNSIDTAMDLDLISASFSFTGTEFGVADPDVPMPKNISLLNPGWECGPMGTDSSGTTAGRSMWTCCAENVTAINTTAKDSGFLPRASGDVVMYYDVFQTFGDNYWAKVSISMEDPLGRIDHWNLTWDWRQGEFIFAMKGAQILGPQEQDKCVLGKAGQYYASMDFSQVMSCSASPTIVDLPQDQKDNPAVAVPNCCRNGTLLPELVDASQTKSEFQVQVYKLPPNLDRDEIQPPVNWNIGEGYQCSQPRAVSPSEFSPDNIHSQSAVKSWQVVCNKTETKAKKCCVSFSTFYNDSVVPCPTCACGCASNTFPWNGQKCNPDIDPMFLPYNGVLLPPSNRTALGLQLAKLDHYSVPTDVQACPDNCGVAINWHIYSDYVDGWSARITLFNWDKTSVPKWFSAIELEKAMPGYQNVYSFNGTIMPDLNDALLMQGHFGYDNDYLLAIDPKDNPGKLQSLMSFDKRKTPGINVVKGDGFPTKVWFNGDECAIPSYFPTGAAAWQARPSLRLSLGALVLALALLVGGRDLL
ncbi:hypothetical protein MPTK1_1g18890 [Marchantia polymorpha subsp. ruderalis]|uniref:COBRA C-terminal domain-containing protein n=3 Tax=Marchantia polymorpha TaxID=3197 RepID=A0AAF6ARQ0_MARPO|nr:hypothetical protein MARPO_0001s0227 [Marchantia polymorpha]BBM99120.1 hypothetical protein Mp_1g18890 [Marchantia polymorpha subsp. ruderalis]|eukprot:PTQ50197.1 hypothetical protein MARPO_0001s0227 [Marchantia polymorpha]